MGSPEIVVVLEEPANQYVVFTNRNLSSGRALWLTPVIPAPTWEAEAGGPQSQEFETSLANIVKPCLY